MADFFSDLFGAITGQQSVPQQTIIPTNELLGQSYSTLNSQVAPGLVAFNQAMAPGIADVGLGVTNQLDPSILANLRGANAGILNELNLGGALGQELQENVVRNALEGVTGSGFGVSPGGRGLVARDLGLTEMDVRRRRQQDALAAGSQGFQLSRQLYDPQAYTGLGAGLAQGISQDIRGVQAARDELANLTEDIRRQNFASVLNTGTRIAGTVIGGIYGGAAGAQAGGAIGNNVFSRAGVAGRSRPQESGGGGFMSMLGGMMGGGGSMGQYSAGAGQLYGDDAGNVMTSTKASGVNLAGF